jgi:hypothetical protein
LHNGENVACLCHSSCSKIKSSKAKYSDMCTKNLTDGAFCFHRHRHSSMMRMLSTDNHDRCLSKDVLLPSTKECTFEFFKKKKLSVLGK